MKAQFHLNLIIYRPLQGGGFMFSWRGPGEKCEINMNRFSSAIVINIGLVLGQVEFVNGMDKHEFNRTECSLITGIPARRILFYAEQHGLLNVKKPGGHGNARKYSRKDIAELLLIKELAARGVTVSEMCEIVQHLRENKSEWWDSSKLDYKRS